MSTFSGEGQLTKAGPKVEDSYIQLQLQWDGDKFSHYCQHYVSIKEMNHFMRRGVWLGESASFFR
jgi:hypothetical protein